MGSSLGREYRPEQSATTVRRPTETELLPTSQIAAPFTPPKNHASVEFDNEQIRYIGIDPRSPSMNVCRTPPARYAAFMDPRSPSVGIERKHPYYSTMGHIGQSVQSLLDPRSPMADMSRTPLPAGTRGEVSTRSTSFSLPFGNDELVDPRSPAPNLARTPVPQLGNQHQLPAALLNCRSPTVGLTRTPVPMLGAFDGLSASDVADIVVGNEMMSQDTELLKDADALGDDTTSLQIMLEPETEEEVNDAIPDVISCIPPTPVVVMARTSSGTSSHGHRTSSGTPRRHSTLSHSETLTHIRHNRPVIVRQHSLDGTLKPLQVKSMSAGRPTGTRRASIDIGALTNVQHAASNVQPTMQALLQFEEALRKPQSRRSSFADEIFGGNENADGGLMHSPCSPVPPGSPSSRRGSIASKTRRDSLDSRRVFGVLQNNSQISLNLHGGNTMPIDEHSASFAINTVIV